MSEWQYAGQFYQDLPGYIYDSAKYAGKVGAKLYPALAAGEAAYNLYQSYRSSNPAFETRYIVKPSWGYYNTKYGYRKKSFGRPQYRQKVKSRYRYRYLQRKYGNRYNDRYSRKYNIARPYFNY